MKKYINPLADLGSLLLNVEKPNRYIGAEFGLMAKKDAPFQTVIAFPDLYEIGMSNKAMRILYNNLNLTEGISCDRVFAPAPDFEALLRERGIPIYGLETGINPGAADILMFTLGYELGITNVLTILDLSGINLLSGQRCKNDPVVIMGGPCVSNPLPYSPFIDCFWLGEAEGEPPGFSLPPGGFFSLMAEARDLKRRGGDRDEIKNKILSHPSVWSPGKKKAARAIYSGFGSGEFQAAVYPVPVIKTVQHQGAVEIMRGCPNGCRFCHAGFWYRPMRQKNINQIKKETASFIENGGYREISLSSLSTGDYQGICELAGELNREYKNRHISFQLPSLRVSGFSLPLLGEISEVRKSGLTFAVETPNEFQQLSINKKVSLENIAGIIGEAKKKGWRGVKFYFMIGLPDGPHGYNATDNSELNIQNPCEEEIINFITAAARKTGMHFNINLGTFIPKPHTPYQWAGQISSDQAERKMYYIKDKLKRQGHKIGIQDPFISELEGIISRGDENVAVMLQKAWEKGCRLDAWSDYLKKNIWEELFNDNLSLIKKTLDPRSPELPLPWDCIKSGVDIDYFKNEKNKSQEGEITLHCSKKCTNNCGVCKNGTEIVQNNIHVNVNSELKQVPGNQDLSAERNSTIKPDSPEKKDRLGKRDPLVWKLIFSFAKEGPAIFHSHLDLMELFFMTFLRAAIPVAYSSGFNPLPVLEIVSPLSVGIAALDEIASVEILEPVSADFFLDVMNKNLSPGVKINTAELIHIPSGTKKHSLSAWLWGSAYEFSGCTEYIPFASEKKYRQEKMNAVKPSGYSNINFRRVTVLAKDPEFPDARGKSYFDVFRFLYPGPDNRQN